MKKKTIYIGFLIMMFSFTSVYASGLEASAVENVLEELTIEDAIIKAQARNKKLRMQRTNIEYAQAEKDMAKEQYDGVPDSHFDQALAGYSKATTMVEYERKNETVIAEQVAFDVETYFDDILELQEKSQLAHKTLQLQKQKVNHAIIKEQLGLGSKVATQAEKTKLEVQEKDIEGLTQAIDTGYRKLNHAIGGKETRYNLVKENSYEPLDMNRSLEGQVSRAINNDIGLWLQEELAEAEKIAFIAPGPDGYAPTYTLYQQRKLSYEQAVNNVALSKEGKEEQVKRTYENIQGLQIQHDKILIDLGESQRQYEIMKKRHELGMITDMNLQEVELAVLQNEMQLSSTIRQHNQLKMLFEKAYLSGSMELR